MTLKNLPGISLDAISADKVSVGMLIAAAERNIADAQLQGLSSENQFDAAYKSIMEMAMVALNADGYRTRKSKPRASPDGDPDATAHRWSSAAEGHRS